MYDWFPESWKIMVEKGVAAQHYPPDWPNDCLKMYVSKKQRKRLSASNRKFVKDYHGLTMHDGDVPTLLQQSAYKHSFCFSVSAKICANIFAFRQNYYIIASC